MAKQEFSLPALMAKVPTEASAYELLEDLRWNGQPVCPHCASVAKHYFLKPRDPEGRKTRTGAISQRRVWKCKDCRKQFSVLTGTIFHGSKIPVRTWLMVVFEMCASKNGVAARELERKYDLTPKSAWFMLHRIREAMKREPLAGLLSGTVVADETWIGGKPKNRHAFKRQGGKQGLTDKQPVLSLVNTETGEVRSHVVRDVTADTIGPILRGEIDTVNTVLHTDRAGVYVPLGTEFADHQSVDHRAGEYVRGEVSTNAAEGYFSQLKRSIDGTHHAVSNEHLHRYLGEFDFRYTTRKISDSARMRMLALETGGRRLSYRPLTQGE
jgi:transposase-like protein